MTAHHFDRFLHTFHTDSDLLLHSFQPLSDSLGIQFPISAYTARTHPLVLVDCLYH